VGREHLTSGTLLGRAVDPCGGSVRVAGWGLRVSEWFQHILGTLSQMYVLEPDLDAGSLGQHCGPQPFLSSFFCVVIVTPVNLCLTRDKIHTLEFIFVLPIYAETRLLNDIATPFFPLWNNKVLNSVQSELFTSWTFLRREPLDDYMNTHKTFSNSPNSLGAQADSLSLLNF